MHEGKGFGFNYSRLSTRVLRTRAVESLRVGPLGGRGVPAVRRRLVARVVDVKAAATGRMVVELRLFRQTCRGIRRCGV